MNINRLKFLVVTSLAAAIVVGGNVQADELESFDAEDAQQIGAALSSEASNIKNPQVTVSPDSDRAQGVHRPEEAGVVIVPHDELREVIQDQDLVEKESGAALGYLFSYRIFPVVNGRSIDSSKLRQVSLTNDSGDAFTVQCMILAVRRVSDNDWRLYVYGEGAKPLIDVPFSEGIGPGHEPLAVEVTGIEDRKGNLVVTVLDQYQAQFKVSYEEN